jgi:hypothetical protein
LKAILIKTTGECREIELNDEEPLYKEMRKHIGGHMEHVLPRRLEEPYCLIVNEEGLLLHLQRNPIASYLYETDKHGYPIVGNVVIMKDGYRNGEPDIVGLDDDDIMELAVVLNDVQLALENMAPIKRAAWGCG